MPWGPGPTPKTTTTITPARDPKQSFLFSGGVGRKGQWESCGRHLGGIWDASGKHLRFWKASRRHQTFLTPPQKMNGLWKHLGDLERSIWETSWRALMCILGCAGALFPGVGCCWQGWAWDRGAAQGALLHGPNDWKNLTCTITNTINI